MLKVSLMESALLIFFGSFMVLQVLAVTCYHLDGTNAGPSNALCNPKYVGSRIISASLLSQQDMP